MSEKAQISMEPKAKGVKMIKAMRRILITLLNIVQCSKLKAES